MELYSEQAFFAHIHIAKTAGSSFNRILARNFLGICGYKGYSFMQPFEDVFINRKDPRYPRRHRNKVAQARMFDWGFHNCALVSHETEWTLWKKITQRFREGGVPLVMMLPCRDPVDHFLSMCNYKKIDVTHLFRYKSCEVAKKCFIQPERFNMSMLSFFDKVILYQYMEIPAILELLRPKLPARILSLTSKKRYVTNTARKVESENLGACTRTKLEEFLHSEWEYYGLCDRLKGRYSVLDLPLYKQ